METRWTCVICGHRVTGAVVPAREGMLCPVCRSTWRVRAIAVAILTGLRLPLRPLPEVVQDFSRAGIGISDNAGLAAALASKFDYTNTYYHRFPRLDVTKPPDDLKGRLEFLSCSDVLEHVPPPIEKAAAGISKMIRPRGFALISVPIGGGLETKEYYPRLKRWEIVNGCLEWIDLNGEIHRDEHPEFHGGEGQTLAFRRWSEKGLKDCLIEAGFEEVVGASCCPDLGVPFIASAGVFIAQAGADHAIPAPASSRAF